MPEQMNWQERLDTVKEMARVGAERAKEQSALLYDRVQHMMILKDDPEFLAAMKEEGQDVYKLFDSYLADTTKRFSTFVALLEMFPQRSDWEGQLLNTLLAKMLEAKAKKKDRHAPKPVQWRKECEKFEQKYLKTKAELKDARADLKLKEMELNELKAENEDLKAQLEAVGVSPETADQA